MEKNRKKLRLYKKSIKIQKKYLKITKKKLKIIMKKLLNYKMIYLIQNKEIPFI